METIKIQSDISQMRVVEDFVSNVCDERNVHNYFATIDTSVLQAVENAILHGNGGDGSKCVIVSCGSCKGGLFFSVQDEGCGFDWRQYGEMPLEGSRGLGLFMMRALSDKMEFSSNGSCVRLEFYVSGIDKAISSKRAACLQNFFSCSKVGV
ncbi:MAG: ATP-binding protein [Bacteroidales bacterium]|nr:ATP-binding protein [Bacteroidales bacterium]